MIVLTYKYGQLGNRLSYLKDFFAIALEYNVRVILLCFDEYTDYFSGTSRGFFCSFPYQCGRSIGKSMFSKGLRCLLHLLGVIFNRLGCNSASLFPEPDENGCLVLEGERADVYKKKLVLFLSGWPCVPTELIEKHSERIREYFSLVEEHASRVKYVIDKAKTYGDFLVGIHIRQGDYRVWNGGKFFFETDVYVKLMKKITQKHEDRHVVFIICSNEEQNWSLFEEFSFVAGPGYAVGDMYSLAECDEIYGPQSSFSAWASFYGKVPLYEVQNLIGPL